MAIMGKVYTMNRTQVRVLAGVSMAGLARIAGVCEATAKAYERDGEVHGADKNAALRAAYEWMAAVPYRGVVSVATGLPVK